MQDILATLIAALALAVLLQRTFGMFFTKDESPGCDGCSACPAPSAVAEKPEAAAPMVFLRRSPSAEQR